MDAHRYDDIIQLPHHQSPTHKHMGMIDRAAQFSPFAALTGYGDCIKETARVTDRRVELDDDEKAAISERLYLLQTKLAELPRGQIADVVIEYFVPDKAKAGGSYVKLTGAVKKVDDCAQCVLMAEGTRIPMEDILSVSGAIFDSGTADE